MSHTMNGRPLHCAPARTKTLEINWTPDLDPKAELAELPKLIERAIARGLVYRPKVDLAPVKEQRVVNPRLPIIHIECPICGVNFAINRRNRLKTCGRECATQLMIKTAAERRALKQQKQQ